MTTSLADVLAERKRRRYRGGDDPESQLRGFLEFCQHEIKIDGPSGQGLVTFQLRDAQVETVRAFLENDQVIILKARQIGYSTLVTIFCLWRALFFPNYRMILLSKKEDDAKSTLSKAIVAYNLLDEKFKQHLPKRKEKNVKRISFDNGSWVESHPSADNPARGRTVDLLILDELAFMPNPDEAWASVRPVYADGGRVIALSTANGFGNLYQELWQKARLGQSGFRPLFFPWSANPERTQDWFEAQVRDMAPHLRAQEYPEDEDEAFIKSGDPVFDIEVLRSIKPMEPTRCDFHVGDERFPRDFTVQEHHQGKLYVYERPLPDHTYVIGADVAMGLKHGDFSCAQVIDIDTLMVAATWHGKLDPDLFGMELARLGWWYRTALVAPESNSFGLTTVKTLQHKAKYGRIYRRHRYTSRLEARTEEMGWYTSHSTKPSIIADLIAAVREGSLGLFDQGTITEMTQYVRDEKGLTNGSPFDDRVMALAIALRMLQHVNSPQQKPDLPPEEVYGTFEFEHARIQQRARKSDSWVLGGGNVTATAGAVTSW